MKKKVFSVLTLFVLLLTSVVFTACGKRYDKLEFEIWYAYSADATEWFNANGGVSLNFGNADDKLEITEDHDGLVYFKVNIKNVKAKHIDDIVVSKIGGSYHGTSFTSATVVQGQVFAIPVSGNVDTALKFYETNSGKECSIEFEVSRSLSEISVDTSKIPALTFNNSLNLASLDNLIYHPTSQEDINFTRQTGVVYEVEDVGYYEAQTWVTSGNANKTKVKIEDGVLSLDGLNITENCNIVKIKATSIHDENISAIFNVVLIDNPETIIDVKYNNTGNNFDLTNGATLYVKSDNYYRTDISITKPDGVFADGISLGNGMTAKYVLAAKVDGEDYVLTNEAEALQKNGIKVVADKDNDNVVHVIALDLNDAQSALEAENKIELRWVVSYLDYKNENTDEVDALYIGKTLKIHKRTLPNNILINDNIVTEFNDTATIYGTNNPNYHGIELNLRATPLDINSNATITIARNESLIFKSQDKRPLPLNDTLTAYEVESGSTIFVNFDQTVNQNQQVEFTVVSSPVTFEGELVPAETVKVVYNLEKKVTADDVVVKLANDQTLNANETLYTTTDKTPFILDVYYTGDVTLDESTISLNIVNSSGSNILFAPESGVAVEEVKNLVLNNDIYVLQGGKTNVSLTQFKATYYLYLNSSKVGDSATITIVAGDTNVGVVKSFNVECVNTSNPDDFDVLATCTQGDSYVKDLTPADATKKYFAITQNKTVKFQLNDNNIAGINLLDVQNSDELVINYDANSNFYIVENPTSEGLRIVELQVSYFKVDATSNAVILCTGSQAYKIQIEMYVCSSIVSLNLSGTPRFTYINSKYTEASTIIVSFDATNVNGATPLERIVFSDFESDITSTIKLSFDKLFENNNNYDRVRISLITPSLTKVFTEDELKAGDIRLQIDENIILKGQIKIELLSELVDSEADIKLMFVPTFFDADLSTIPFNVQRVSYQASEGIQLDDVKTNESNQYQVDISFRDVSDEQRYAQVQFGAKAVYSGNQSNKYKDLDFNVVKLTKVGESYTESPANDFFAIVVQNDIVTLTADKENKGGLFKIVISTRDSYNDATGLYARSVDLYVKVSDGTQENPYVVYNLDDLKAINNNLTAYYVLGDNIEVAIDSNFTPIGGTEGFAGCLSGVMDTPAIGGAHLVTRYKITVRMSAGNVVTNPTAGTMTYTGLFSRLVEKNIEGKTYIGKVSDIDIDVYFAGLNITANTAGITNIGAIAGENNGVIQNVNLKIKTINDKDITTLKNITNTINFGGMVGMNNGTIILADNAVSCENQLNIVSTCATIHNIGLVAGYNAGTIRGNYLGQASLQSFSYTIVSNINISNQATAVGTKYFVGGVAGENNQAQITGILIGGAMHITDNNSSDDYRITVDSAIAGLVGKNMGVKEDEKSIYTNAVLGLNIDSTGTKNIKTAGAVGISTNAKIEDIRVMTAQVTFHAGLGQTTGKIVGANIVAGAIASSSGDELNQIAVENFIQTIQILGNDLETFYMLCSNNNNVAGLVYSASSTTIDRSFVNTNIDIVTGVGANIYLTSNGATEKDTYFIGRVKDVTTTTEFVTENSTYAVIYDDSNMFNVQANAITNFVESDYNSIVSACSDADIWATTENINKVGIFNLPYLIDGEGNQLMIIRPDEITPSINETYVAEIKSKYVTTISLSGYDVTHTAIINFKDTGFSADIETNNTYDLVYNPATGKGLINLTVVPTNAAGGVKFEVVQGTNFATIKNNSTITFKGVSRDKTTKQPIPIIIKCSSIFNPDLVEYVVLFTELGITDLVLSSNDITIVGEQQQIVTYTGNSAHIVQIKAENVDNLNGNVYDSILSSEVAKQSLIVECLENNNVGVGGNKVVDVVLDNALSGGVMLSIDKDAMPDEESSREITLTFTLKNNLSQYYPEAFPKVDLDEDGLVEDHIVEIGSKTLKVIVYKVATDIRIVEGGGYVEYTSQSNIKYTVDIDTAYVNSADTIPTTLTTGFDLTYDTVDLGITGKEGLKLKLEVLEGVEEVEKLLLVTNNTKLTELFDFAFTYKLRSGLEKGYRYNVELCLKDEFNYRYISNNIKLKVYFIATRNEDVSCSAEVVLKPTNLSKLKIENYQAKSINAYTTYTELITRSYSETYTIIPGGYGGVMLLYLQPAYADIKTATLTSNQVPVQTLGRDISIIYEQLIYNESTGNYETITPTNEKVDGGIKLRFISGKKVDGSYYYNGVLYVHTMLDKFVGPEKHLTATLTVETGSGEIKSTHKTLLTKYLPGATLAYDQTKAVADGYLIQNQTNQNTVDITVYGYQFNTNPQIGFEWNLSDFTKYTYGQFNPVDIRYEQQFIEKVGNLYVLEYGQYKLATNYDETKQYFEPSNKAIIYNIADEEFTNPIRIANYVNAIIDKNYNAINPNGDGSYTIPARIITSNVPANFSMFATLELTNELGKFQSDKAYLNFYPTDYILKSVDIGNINNDTMNVIINHSDIVELVFGTDNANKDFSLELYEELYNDIFAEQVVETINGVQTIRNKEISELFRLGRTNLSQSNDKFDINLIDLADGKDDIYYLSIFGKDVLRDRIEFNVMYNYVLDETTGLYNIKFMSSGGRFDLSTSFVLNITATTTQEHAIPIANANDFKTKLSEGLDYILTDDIVLEDYTPTTVAIASLDGNNKKITIKNFAIDVEVSNYGLFGQIGTYTDDMGNVHETILKNVIVDYSQCANISFLSNQMTKIVFGGLVAENNGGLIYNCDVMNISGFSKVLDIMVDPSATITFGGLVGINNGIITNSRVGRSGLDIVSMTSEGREQVSPVSASGITFKISGGADTEIAQINGFTGIVGGFVGVNKSKAIIASSYVQNTNIINYSMEGAKTAGFVAENNSSAKISYSYVRGGNTTATSTFLKDYKIESPTDGIVAGFVYTNDGNIDNAYANVHLVSESNYLAGFVYNNTGKISESFTAVTINNVAGGAQISERPFVGINDQNVVLQKGVLENVYYLAPSLSKIITDEPAKGILASSFADPDNLINFVFIQSSLKSETEQGVWSYYNANGTRVSLPELVSANAVSTSYRYTVKVEDNQQFVYDYAPSYRLGTKNNPYTISNKNEYNNVFTGGEYGTQQDKKVKSGYFRMINNIDFGTTAILTRAYFSLGNNQNNLITNLDGNGMSISGVYLDALSGYTEGDSVGLFSEINNAYIKNLSIKFSTPPSNNATSTTNVTYVGGLAGKIDNSIIININLDGANTVISGHNIVGGVAGIIKGGSLLYGIASNLSVEVDVQGAGNFYLNEQDYNKLKALRPTEFTQSYNNYMNSVSYGGGLAGVIDITKRQKGTADFNVSYVQIQGDKMATMPEGDYNILADYAGGIAGYASSSVAALRTNFVVGDKTRIKGQHAVGGLYAVALGSITASSVASVEEDKYQYSYDTTLGKYVIDLKNDVENASIDTVSAGNLSLLEGYQYSGGLVGMSIGTTINSCYSKASFTTKYNQENSSGDAVIGGLLGLSIDGSVVYSYAVPYINITPDMKQIGGLIGHTYGGSENNKYVDILKLNHIYADLQSSVDFAFSTLIVNDVEPSHEIQIDYLNGNGSDKLQSVMTKVNFGEVNYKNVSVTKPTNTGFTQLSYLYDLTEEDVQYKTFNDMFSSWVKSGYWSLKPIKYFPLLKQEEVLDFIPIYNVDDLLQVKYNPDLNYMVMNDIEFIGQQTGNYILDCHFTGILMGNVQNNGAIPVIKGLNLNTNKNGNTGFFRSTEDAEIINLSFEWNPVQDYNDSAIKINNEITSVGGVSCHDIGSLFSGLTVNVTTNVNHKNELDNHFLKTDNKTIQNFGGIVANGTDTTIMDCIFAGSVSTGLKVNDINGAVNFGGIIGYLDSTEGGVVVGDNNQKELEAAVVSNCAVGVDSPVGEAIATTKFNLKISQESIVNIGAVVGWIKNGSVSGVKVGGQNYNPAYQKIEINLDLNTTKKSVNLGGLVGYSDATILSDNKCSTAITVTGTMQNGNVLSVGALAGLSTNRDGMISSIKNSAKSEINLIKVVAETVYVGGIANATNTAIQENIFTGFVRTYSEAEDKKATIKNIYAGGIAGTFSDGLSIAQSISAMDMFINSTSNIYAGGLVGGSNNDIQDISNSISSGRIVPLFPVENADAIIYIGGLIGYANSININQLENDFVLSTSSIITDGILGKQFTYSDVNINALFGNVSNKVVKNIYYSSDLALCTDIEGTNLSAAALYVGGWSSKLVENNTLFDKKVDTNALPYLKSLMDDMINFNVFDDKNDNYKDGSSLNPVDLSNNFEAKEGFTYYLLSNTNSTLPNFANAIGISKELKGVIIGAEIEYVATNGSIPTVAKHSAVSNIHLDLTNGTNINGATNAKGLIVDTNNGVIFNCSVNGQTLRHTSTSEDNYLGLIVGKNAGLLGYSFSTAEVLEVGKGIIGGLAYNNEGTILSSYFTGYIGVTNTEISGAAGIMYTASANSYVYNTYMAGNINQVASDTNAFSSVSNFAGSNNFVDSWTTGANEIIGVVTSVSTADLMRERTVSGLKGDWYYTVETSSDGQNTTVGFKTENNPTFGFNYGYPIYNFNKQKIIDANGNTEVVPTIYQEYTGTGEGGEDILENRYNKVISNTDQHYQNAYKIPHLGVFTTVHALLGESRNYVVIYDLDGKGKSWAPIGQTDIVNGFTSTGNFNGLLITNRGLEYLENSCCTIGNFTTNGLFDIVGKAYISDIILGSFTNLKNVNGALGRTTSADNADTLVIKNLTFVSSSQVTAFNDNDNVIDENQDIYIGGLIGEVKIQTNIYNIDTSNLTISSTQDTAGVIAGKMTAGSIIGDLVIEDSKKDTQNSNIQLKTTNSDYFKSLGGIVGVMTAGIIKNVRITVASNNLYSNNFGGIVGVVNSTSAENCQIIDCQIESNSYSNTINILRNSTDETVFGLVAGSITGGLTINGLEIKKDLTFVVSAVYRTDENDNSGVGFFTGVQNGDLIVSKVGIIDQEPVTSTKVKSQGVVNLGSIAGLYKSGIINIDDISSLTNLKLSLSGTTNVGGIFGRVDGSLTRTLEIEKEIDPIEGEDENTSVDVTIFTGINLLDAGEQFANITSNILSNSNYSNFGGLFGYLKSDIKGCIIPVDNDADGVYDVIESHTVVNYNLVTIAPAFNSSNFEIVATNVGGISGKFGGTTAQDLLNNATITLSNSTYNDSYFALANGKKVASVNVGGVFGYIENTKEIISIDNNAEIQGYQNVGGLIGYANNNVLVGYKFNRGVDKAGNEIIFTDKITPSSIHEISAQTVKGYINVGGLFGYLGTGTKVYGYNMEKAQVYGNANIGSVVGYANGATISNVSIDNDKGTSVVKGVYVIYHGSQNNYFIPTSVGGFAGRVVSSTLRKNNLSNIYITSSNEGEFVDSYQMPTINTVSNNMLDVQNLEGSNNSLLDTEKLDFNQIKSGYGGFVGTIDQETILSKSDEGEYYISSNSIYGLDINASLGVNVATYFGYANFSVTGEDLTNLKFPTISGNVLVDGGYNIGGIAGYMIGSGSFTNSTAGKSEGTITLQSRLPGMYVGGLFGKLVSDNVNLTLDNNADNSTEIIINTSQSYYMGGLVGRYETNGHDEQKRFAGNLPEKVTTTDLTDYNSADDFGGFIGMLKVKDVDNNPLSGTTVNVTGTHYYPFTVNTIENSNYADGQSNFNANEDKEGVWLVANAYYINLDTFNICATKGDWYMGSESNPVGTSMRDYNNPLNNNAKGWHKTYTGFKAMQRIITNENNPADWDSIAPVYDASNITHVQASTGVDKIEYTIYEESFGIPYLYSAIGIATLWQDNDKEDDVESYPYSHEIGGKDIYYIHANASALSTDNGTVVGSLLNKYNWQKEYETKLKNDGSYEDNTGPERKLSDENTYLIYSVYDYLDNNNFTWFEFQCVYNNSTLSGNDSQLPEDGSIFNVCGTQTDTYTETKVSAGKVFGIIGGALLIIAGVGLAIYSGGSSMGLVILGVGALGGSAVIVQASQMDNISKTHLIDSYFTIYNKNYGYLTGGRNLELIYSGNKLQYSSDRIEYITDSVVNGDGKAQYSYMFYSSQKPSDIYTEYYAKIRTSSSDSAKTLGYLTDGIGKVDNSNYIYELDGTYYLPKYLYMNGQYYIYSDAMKEYLYRAQLFNPSDYTVAQHYYNGAHYTSDYSESNISVQQYFVYQATLDLNEYKLGYDYIEKTLYYSFEKDANIVDDANQYKYFSLNKFVPNEEYLNSHQEGIHYITAQLKEQNGTDADGNPIYGAPTLVYYDVENWVETTKTINAKNKSDWNSYVFTDTADENIVVITYPSVSDKSLGIYLTGKFVNKRNNESATGLTVKQSVTYYYYDYGYEVGTDNESVYLPIDNKITVYNADGISQEISLDSYSSYLEWYVIDVRQITDDNTKEQYKLKNYISSTSNLDVYEKFGTTWYMKDYNYKYKDGYLYSVRYLPAASDMYQQSWIQNAYLTNATYNFYTRYKYTNADGTVSKMENDWFIVIDPDGEGDKDQFVWIENNDDSATINGESYTGFNIYRHNNKYYYYYYSDDGTNGFRSYEVSYDDIKGYIGDTHRFVEMRHVDEGDKKGELLYWLVYVKTFNLYPTNGTLNNGTKTYFVESLRVTLGGGKVLTSTGRDNFTSGTITIS
ncbi:MAG: hypothetical protein IKM43_04415 [Clostridia bacterium]|nr:hypothetical protein [Clostridia bacterium]